MPRFKVEPPIPHHYAVLLVAAASAPDAFLETNEEGAITKVELSEEQAQSFNDTYVGLLRLTEESKER